MSTCQALELLLFNHSVMSNSETPTDCSTPGFPVLYYLLELAQTHVYLVSDGIQPSHPLSPPFPFALNLSQHQVVKVVELQLQHQSFQWIFRVDFLQDWLIWSTCCPRDSEESSPALHWMWSEVSQSCPTLSTAEFSKFAGLLSAALSQHHLLGFEIAQLEFHHLH